MHERQCISASCILMVKQYMLYLCFFKSMPPGCQGVRNSFMHSCVAGCHLQRTEENGRQEPQIAGESTPYEGGVIARLQSTLSAPLTSRCAPQLPIILGNTWLLHQQAAAVAAHTCLCICQSTLILRGRAAVVLLLCNICCYSFRSPVIHMLTCRLGFRLRIMHDPDPTAWSVL